MKEKMKPIIKCTCFFMILLLLLLLTSRLFMPKNNTSDFGMGAETANGILGEKQNTIDVVVVGDSESYSSFSPMHMWKEHGFTSYVCGTPGQPLYLSSQFVQQALAHQKPSVVILETNTIFRKNQLGAHILSKLQSNFSVFEYHNRWKSLTVNDLNSSTNYTWKNDYKGYVYENDIDAAKEHGYMTPTDEKEEIPELNLLCLKEIIDTCKKNNVTLMFVSTPSTQNWNYKKHNSVQEFADKHQIKYLDLNLLTKKLDINWKTDTRDKGDHLNYTGAVKVSSYLGDYLKENFSLKDHRKNKDYSSWNDALRRYTSVVEVKG